MNTIILSICIPTLNRKEYLEENLSLLVPQVEMYSNNVEIIVSDNCSDDKSMEILSRYNNLSFYNYYKQNARLSAYDHFSCLVEKAKGEFVYLLGDDDLLSPNFLDVIMPLLNKYPELGILHFNRLSGDSNCSNNHLHDSEFDGMIKILNFGQFVERVLSSPNFMSSSIFNKITWENGQLFTSKDRYYGYRFLATIYYGSIKKKCLYYYMPLVIMRNPPREWVRDKFLYIFIGMSNLFYDLNNYVPGIYSKWQNRLRGNIFYDYSDIMLSMIEHVNYYKQFQNEILCHLVSRKERLIVKFAFKIKPIWLLKITYRLYFKITKVLNGKLY